MLLGDSAAAWVDGALRFRLLGKLALVAGLAVLALSLGGSSIAAQEGDEPQRVRVGLFLIHIGSVDEDNGTFTADFYLSFGCDSACDPTRFEFLNGRATYIDLQEDTPTSRVYRIQADLTTVLDLGNYPFDKQRLEIVLEDGVESLETLVYEPDLAGSGIADGAEVAGWDLNSDFDVAVVEQPYPVFGEDYSRYVFSVELARPVGSGLLKGVFPAVVIVGVGLLALFVRSEHLSHRVAMGTAALLGSVIFHLNLTSAVPPTSYLTFADRFMGVNYIALGLALAVTVAMMVVSTRGETARADRLRSFTAVPIIGVWAILQGLNGALL